MLNDDPNLMSKYHLIFRITNDFVTILPRILDFVIVKVIDHFYHIGSKIEFRNRISEALVISKSFAVLDV